MSVSNTNQQINEELLEDVAFQKKAKSADRLATVLRYGCIYGGLASFAYFSYLILISPAESVSADIFVQYISALPLSHIIAYLVGVTGIVFGLYQRRLLQSYRAHVIDHVDTLEQQLISQDRSEKQVRHDKYPLEDV